MEPEVQLRPKPTEIDNLSAQTTRIAETSHPAPFLGNDQPKTIEAASQRESSNNKAAHDAPQVLLHANLVSDGILQAEVLNSLLSSPLDTSNAADRRNSSGEDFNLLPCESRCLVLALKDVPTYQLWDGEQLTRKLRPSPTSSRSVQAVEHSAVAPLSSATLAPAEAASEAASGPTADSLADEAAQTRRQVGGGRSCRVQLQGEAADSNSRQAGLQPLEHCLIYIPPVLVDAALHSQVDQRVAQQVRLSYYGDFQDEGSPKPPPPPSPLAAATAATAAPSCSLELPELPRRRNSDTPVTVSLQLEVSNHPPELLASLNALRCEAAFTDVALEADTCTLHAHRALLAAASPYFRAMFSSQFKEGAASTVSVTSVSGETLRLIVEYVYTSKIEITTDNVQDLTVGCKLLHFPLILHQCVSFLMHHLDSTNAVTMEQFAAAYDFVELREEARQRVLENFASLAESNELAELTLEQLTGCLQSDDLFVRSEDEVARAVLRWVGHRPVERSQHLSGLLLGSRLSCLSREFIQSELLPSPLLRDFSSELLTQLTGHLSLEESPDATPRPSTLRREQLVVLSHDYLEAYNPAKDKWCRIAFPAGGFRPTARDSAVCVLENEIWLTGGVDSQGRALPDVVRYSPLTNAWSEGPPLLSARSRHTCVCVRGSLLVMGGVGLDGRMCTGAEVLRLRAGGEWPLGGGEADKQ
uniref:BTB domain-containing protein n=1 Tax=Macrostomum lignano TaxID=282301 RepID=A0A1I8GYV9_9PLAT